MWYTVDDGKNGTKREKGRRDETDGSEKKTQRGGLAVHPAVGGRCTDVLHPAGRALFRLFVLPLPHLCGSGVRAFAARGRHLSKLHRRMGIRYDLSAGVRRGVRGVRLRGADHRVLQPVHGVAAQSGFPRARRHAYDLLFADRGHLRRDGGGHRPRRQPRGYGHDRRCRLAL